MKVKILIYLELHRVLVVAHRIFVVTHRIFRCGTQVHRFLSSYGAWAQ